MDPQALENEARSAIAGASTLAELDEARVRYLGRRSDLKQALREVRDAETGSVLNTLREGLEGAVAERQAELERADLDRRLTEEVADITLPGEQRPRGHLHLITQIRREVEDIFLGLGYQVLDGREVETTRYNFDGLNFPPDHPARSPLQSLFLNGDVLLRTETSPSQVRVMETLENARNHSIDLSMEVLSQRVQQWAGTEKRKDDQSILAMERAPFVGA